MPLMARFTWSDGVSARFYADSWADVQAVVDEMSDDGRAALRSVEWPHEEEE